MRKTRKNGKRQRRLFFQTLEKRECLAFTYAGTLNGAHLITGTEGVDNLFSIYIGANGNIHFSTNPTGWFGTGIVDTKVAAPTAAAPILIRIEGSGGNDVVDLFAGSATLADNNLGGFAANSVTEISFVGGNGNDSFSPP